MTFYARPGEVITDALGRAIEYAVPNNKESEVFADVFSKTIEDAAIPELILLPPDSRLRIARSSLTVDKPTLLADLLNSFEGPIDGHWAACLSGGQFKGQVRSFSAMSVSEELLDAIYDWK